MQVTTGGQNFEVRNITLSSTVDTAVDFSQQVNSVILKARTGIDVYIRRSQGGADYFTIPAGGSFTLDVAMGDSSQGGFIACWARAESGTPVLEAIGTF